MAHDNGGTMKNVFKLIQIMSLATIISSCAYEKDPGLAPLAGPDGKPASVDVLKGKTSAQVLKEKYKNLKATCELKQVVTAIPAPPKAVTSADTQETPPVSPPIEVKPVAQPVIDPASKDKLSLDVVEQAKLDAELKNELSAMLTLTGQPEGAAVMTADIKISPVVFKELNNQKNETTIMLRKHSPVLAMTVVLKETASDRTDESKAISMSVGESIKMSEVLKTSSSATEKTEIVLECNMSGEISKDEYKDQNLDIDCKGTDEKQKELRAANCTADGKPKPDAADAPAAVEPQANK